MKQQMTQTAVDKHPKNTPLTPKQCLERARAIGMDRQAWEHLVRFDRDHRHYALLERNDVFETWLLCWEVGNDTGWHDHDGSSAGIFVPHGPVVEMQASLDGARSRTLHDQEGVFHDGHAIHRMTAGETPGISIHVYSPPLSRMGAYRVDEQGHIQRVVQGENEALVHE